MVGWRRQKGVKKEGDADAGKSGGIQRWWLGMSV